MPTSKESFFVFHDGQALGPFPHAELKKKLKAQEISYTDHVWLNTEHEWQMLAYFFAADFPPPKEPPPGVEVDESAKEKKLQAREFSGQTFSQDIGVSNEPIWFVYRENTKFGPYRYLELVHMLQTNSYSRDDFVWKPGFEDWLRLRQCADFDEKILQKLANIKNTGTEKIFVQRRFPRVPYEGEVIVHDENRVIFGNARSISEGGAFVMVSKPTHAKGDRIKMHFSPGAVTVPFNCIAEVTQVSKGEPTGYNVKFIYLEESDRKRIADYAYSVEAGKKGG